ncbi:DUF1365 family protein [Nocardioides sp. TRM66260-LWL]|uniref:FAD-dependent oxidoreductase n=1 Tax=Nocardioides sp. TRM66260-LWL TaxID=2874478 RepID=UPI001CC7FC8C|nr:FAD-dependent oxidoreductase [Nocardioides sp. TRM66260-LWL]MBZ5736001.1 DUF1365 family protein [Nocardioides sp. TRM66260-LWL]
MSSAPTGRRVAVVGSGVAGLTAAYVASRTAHVTLYEADDRLGGHADTHRVPDPSGRELRIDTGFIVHNRRTYPVLLRLFRELGVATQQSEMSMSISDDETGLEWAGALGRAGVFPTRRHLRDRDYLRMLTEVPRFHRQAKALLAVPGDDVTLGDFLDQHRFTPYFRRHFMEPLVAAVWSCDPDVALQYPARYLFAFLQHHGMLAVFGSPTWRTVSNGSHSYVDAVAAHLHEIRTGSKVTSVLETADGVEITDGNGRTDRFDAVVIAAHPSQALSMLAEPTPLHRELLGAMPYSPNTALLHTDLSLLPRHRSTWASWNFRRVAGERGGVTVTYDLTRLQRLDTDVHYLVTLGGEDLVDPATVIDRMEYEHPLYTPTSVAAQARLRELDTDRVVFAGAYHGWGFHEDGARSGLAAAERLGLPWSEPTVVVDAPAPADVTGVYATTIRHTRRRPWTRSFEHTSHTWVVDLDDLPDHRPLGLVRGTFEARDHLGSPDRTIRANVEAFLAAHDITADGLILMCAQPRAFGYCFNPISVFWCHDAAGRRVATVVEVHNTYGDRHAYLVQPDEQGRASTPKAMYVSPFHGTDGSYDLVAPTPADDALTVAVTLTTDDGARFSASMHGRRVTHAPPVRRAALAALRGSLLIRAHGIWLWLRRLPVQSRPSHAQPHVQENR